MGNRLMIGKTISQKINVSELSVLCVMVIFIYKYLDFMV